MKIAKPSDGFAVTDETRMKPSDNVLLSPTPPPGSDRPGAGLTLAHRAGARPVQDIIRPLEARSRPSGSEKRSR